ncbi:MAG TPA: type II toxin-antitoxin system HicB family antitoxin [Thermoflexia bacterium]|nr:MAG: type II toxin-antitoxin system HicB family antitoxin [Chloroflexota bacterium]HEY67927.1 type II toxin-antitoxin system HicB family antitoxin [Thermoflexia bacterium]
MQDSRVFFLSLVLEPNDGGYLAHCPSIQGAFAEGDTIEEALFNCVDVIKMILAYRAERGEALGIGEVTLTSETQVTVSIPVGISV